MVGLPWKVLSDHMEVLQDLVGDRGRGRVELVVERAYVSDILDNLPLLGRKVKELLRVEMLAKDLNGRLAVELVNLELEMDGE